MSVIFLGIVGFLGSMLYERTQFSEDSSMQVESQAGARLKKSGLGFIPFGIYGHQVEIC